MPAPDRPRWLPATLFAVLMLLLTVGGSVGEARPLQPADQVYDGHPVPVPQWWAYLFVAIAALALAWRRSRPWPVLAVSVAGVAIYTALGYVNGAALLAPLVALYTVSALSPVREAVLAAIATVVPLGVLTAVFNPLGTFGGAFPVFPVTAGLALATGIAVANRRGRISALEARAELAERTRDEEARRQVDAERLRIARELHDVVAHTMSTINVQAGAAAYAHPDLPEPVTQALAAIKDASKRGLGELRAILAVLRQADQDESTQPVPGLHALGALAETMTTAGLPTTVRTTGAEAPLPAPVDLAAYRIIQESLTNALRHAAPASATVTLVYTDRHLDIEVTDTGPGPSSATGTGHGIRGMSERAAAAGGSLTTGPGRRGGFRVHAHLPRETP
ncbi:sensor histidine kinase [Amycolatopsis benzoatilytica]|uniref:ATP-binding protein n=1 Tax=Amycolatopsis benzoatilytica TaxID=346045 RepID=UPI0003741208|nr:sensor histidine kinase [Amycolatopsis benzoatilytica]